MTKWGLHFDRSGDIVKIRKRLSNAISRRGNDMVSLKDIASRCGVSTATVSKALHDQKDISGETKKRIKEIAKEMGYFPNAAARALKTNRSNNIGVLYVDEAAMGLTHEYFAGVLNGFKTQAEMLGYDITFINTSLVGKKMSYLEHCKYRNFDGVVIVCADFQDSEVQELMSSDLPVVTIDYIHYSCSAVCSNNVKCMSDLVNYIIDMGHKKIAYIHGQEHASVTRDRLAAYYRALESHDIEIPEAYVRQARYLEADEVAAQTEELLDLEEPPTCIIYPDDTAIIGGINVIRQRGLKIPQDISIAGYDGTRISQMQSPKLTTIRQDTDKIGKEAAKRLIDIIKKPKTALVERAVIEGVLLEGESVSKI